MVRIERFLILSLVASVGFTACRKVTVGKSKDGRGEIAGESGGGSGDGAASEGMDSAIDDESLALLKNSEQAADEQEASEDELGGEETEEVVAEGDQGLSERFNMVKWIKTRPKLEPLYKYIDAGNTMFWMGEQAKFRIETNGTFGVSPDFETAATERKVGGKFWLKAYALNLHLKPKDDELGLFVDIGVDATLDKLSMEMWFRIVGDDIASRSILAGFDQTLMREKTMSASVIPGVSGDLGMGGEMGFRTEFGVRQDNVLNMIYTPRASMNSRSALSLGASGVATTGIKGTLRIADIILKGSANLGYHPPTKLVYFDFGLDPGELKLLEGRIYYVVAEVFGKELGTIDIWKPDPVQTIKTPGYSSAFAKFLDKPQDAESCKAAVNSAGSMLAGSIKKLNAYMAEAPEEDKGMTKSAIARTGMVFREVRDSCSAQ